MSVISAVLALTDVIEKVVLTKDAVRKHLDRCRRGDQSIEIADRGVIRRGKDIDRADALTRRQMEK